MTRLAGSWFFCTLNRLDGGSAACIKLALSALEVAMAGVAVARAQAAVTAVKVAALVRATRRNQRIFSAPLLVNYVSSCHSVPFSGTSTPRWHLKYIFVPRLFLNVSIFFVFHAIFIAWISYWNYFIIVDFEVPGPLIHETHLSFTRSFSESEANQRILKCLCQIILTRQFN